MRWDLDSCQSLSGKNEVQYFGVKHEESWSLVLLCLPFLGLFVLNKPSVGVNVKPGLEVT